MLEMPLECLLVLEGFLESLVAKGSLELPGGGAARACCRAQGHVDVPLSGCYAQGSCKGVMLKSMTAEMHMLSS